jgi:hypothetical protein
MHRRRQQPVPLRIRQQNGKPRVHDPDEGVGGAKVDTDDKIVVLHDSASSGHSANVGGSESIRDRAQLLITKTELSELALITNDELQELGKELSSIRYQSPPGPPLTLRQFAAEFNRALKDSGSSYQLRLYLPYTIDLIDEPYTGYSLIHSREVTAIELREMLQEQSLRDVLLFVAGIGGFGCEWFERTIIFGQITGRGLP